VLSTLVLADHAAHLGGPHFGGPFFAGFGFLFLLIPLFWIGLIAIIFAATRRRRRAFAAAGFGGGHGWGPGGWGHPAFGNGSVSAEATLAERFAQGDIEEVEYRARLEVLRANGRQQPPVA
jgi:putative membrane protein